MFAANRSSTLLISVLSSSKDPESAARTHTIARAGVGGLYAGQNARILHGNPMHTSHLSHELEVSNKITEPGNSDCYLTAAASGSAAKVGGRANARCRESLARLARRSLGFDLYAS